LNVGELVIAYTVDRQSMYEGVSSKPGPTKPENSEGLGLENKVKDRVRVRVSN